MFSNFWNFIQNTWRCFYFNYLFHESIKHRCDIFFLNSSSIRLIPTERTAQAMPPQPALNQPRLPNPPQHRHQRPLWIRLWIFLATQREVNSSLMECVLISLWITHGWFVVWKVINKANNIKIRHDNYHDLGPRIYPMMMIFSGRRWRKRKMSNLLFSFVRILASIIFIPLDTFKIPMSKIM